MNQTPMRFGADLLSPSATDYMHALSAGMALPEELWRAAAKVGDIKHDAPDAAVPFLLWELGLEPVARWVPEPRRVLADGRHWQRIRGTPAAIETAMAWIDEAPHYEEHADDIWWDLFQLGFDGPVDGAARRRVTELARLSKSAHTDVVRYYTTDADRREEYIDSSCVDGGALLDDWSGVWVDGSSNPLVSFGHASAEVQALCGLIEIGGELIVHWGTDGVIQLSSTDRGWLDGPWSDAGHGAIFAGVESNLRLWSDAGDLAWADGPWTDGVWLDLPFGQLAFGDISARVVINPAALAIAPMTAAVEATEIVPPGWLAAAWSDGPYMN